MASSKVKADLLYNSTRNLKMIGDDGLLLLLQHISGEYSDIDAKSIIRALADCYQTNVNFRQEQGVARINQEKSLIQLVLTLLDKYSANDAVMAIDMSLVMRNNIRFFQKHMCWVDKQRKLYLRNSYDPGYITWMKDGRDFPVLRRWFIHHYGWRSNITVSQIQALMTIIKPLGIGQEMSQDEMDSKIVMDIMIGKEKL